MYDLYNNTVLDPQSLTEAHASLPTSSLMPPQGIVHIVAAYKDQAVYYNYCNILCIQLHPPESHGLSIPMQEVLMVK